MGAAIVGMHYTGMAAANFAPGAICISAGPRIDTTWLAIIISAFTFLILGSTLLLSVIDAQLQSAIARSASVLRAANEELEQRVAERTLHLTQEKARSESILADLHAAKEVAEAASRAKSAFLATISHEIRTPMNAILGLLELLSYSRLDDEQRETVVLLRGSAGSLLRLIDDILDFSKIEAGKLEIRSEATRLHDVVDQVAQIFGGVASGKGLTLRSEVAPGVPEHVLVDALRLRQVLSNFLSNAIKFTERGDIRLEVRCAAEPGQADLVRFAVTDCGIGMDAPTIARLCEPFVQGDTRTSRRYGGTGLGLAICRRLADLMGGRLEIASTPGMGTTVSFLLPLKAIEPVARNKHPGFLDTNPEIACLPSRAPSIEAAASSGQLILVVDDHPTNRRVLVRQLAWLGYAAEAAANGAEALVRFGERRIAGTPHALVITDCQMPEMDGYELARRIRGIETRDKVRSVVLAFTANTLREAADECRTAGMDDVLTKPIELAELKVKLDRWLPLKPQAGAAPPAIDVASRGPLPADPGLTAEFCEAHEEDMEVLRNALREFRHDAVVRAAHRIKGAARMFGDRALAEAAEKLESVARAQGAWAATDGAAQLVHEETERLFAVAGRSGQGRRA